MSSKALSNLLRPLELAPGIFLPSRILPGPMDGVTEGTFLPALSTRRWVSCWWTPFLRISTGVPRMARLRAWLKPFHDTGLPVIAQIMGTQAELLAETARRLHSAGVLCVDLNCACPSPHVVGNQGGGACLKNPSWICETLLAMGKACEGRPISVKVRTGYQSPAEWQEIAPAIQQARPSFVTCHFRTVSEMYRPVSDGLSRLQQVRESLPEFPLFGSGDIFTPEDALAMVRETGVDGVLAARGLLQNPMLIPQIVAACAGKPIPTLTEEEKISFLRDLANPPKGVKSGNSNGFILRICGSLFGRESPLFRQLVALGKLKECGLLFDQILNSMVK